MSITKAPAEFCPLITAKVVRFSVVWAAKPIQCLNRWLGGFSYCLIKLCECIYEVFGFLIRVWNDICA